MVYREVPNCLSGLTSRDKVLRVSIWNREVSELAPMGRDELNDFSGFLDPWPIFLLIGLIINFRTFDDREESCCEVMDTE